MASAMQLEARVTHPPNPPVSKRCNFCHKKGHLRKDCFALKRRDQNNKSQQRQSSPERRAPRQQTSTGHGSRWRDESHLLEAFSTKEEMRPWILDSATTTHFCFDRSLFSDFEEIQGQNLIGAIQGVSTPVQEICIIFVLSFSKHHMSGQLHLKYSARYFQVMTYIAAVFGICAFGGCIAFIAVGSVRKETFNVHSYYTTALVTFMVGIWCIVLVFDCRKYVHLLEGR